MVDYRLIKYERIRIEFDKAIKDRRPKVIKEYCEGPHTVKVYEARMAAGNHIQNEVRWE